MRTPLTLALMLSVTMVRCGNDPDAMRIAVGPDGQRWMVVECEEKSECWRAAGRRCPAGYVMANEGSDVATGVASPKVTTTTAMMIRCKAGPPPH